MARIWIGLAYGAGIAAAALFVLALGLFVFANTGPGQDWIASLVKPLTNGRVSVEGLRGRFPDSLRVAHAELSDKEGVWLSVDGAAMDWSPFALLFNRLEVARLEAASVSALRRPVDDGEDGGSDFRLDIASLKIEKLETSSAISVRPATFTAEGSLRYASLRDTHAKFDLQRTGEAGTYSFDLTLRDGAAEGVVAIDEGRLGLIAGLLGLEDIGPITLYARASGPPSANAIVLGLKAGAFEANGQGTVDLPSRRARIRFNAHAPAMNPRPGLAWESLEATGRFDGAFDEPAVSAHIELRNLVADGNAIANLAAGLTGSSGALDFAGTATGLRLAGADPGLFARAPIALEGHAELMGPARAIAATISHPLVSIEGTFDLGEPRRAAASIEIPNVAPFAGLAGTELEGRATLTANAAFRDPAIQIQAEGRIAATGGDETILRLFGNDMRLMLAAVAEGANIAISNAQLTGAGTEVRVNGRIAGADLDLTGTVAVADVSRLAPPLSGSARARVAARGPWREARVQATAEGDIAAEGFAREHVALALNANGLTKPLSGDFRAEGGFAGAPFALGGSFAWATNAFALVLDRGEWKSLLAEGKATIPAAGPPSGQGLLRVERLEDIAPFLGQRVGGSLEAALELRTRNGRTAAGVQAKLENLAFDTVRAREVTAGGEILDPAGSPSFALDLAAPEIDASGLRAGATARVTGPLDSLAIRLSSEMPDLGGAPAKFSAAATLRGRGKELLLASFTGDYRGRTATLTAPARIDLADGIAVAEVRAKMGKAGIALRGKLAPALDATANVENLDAETLRPFLPQLAEGTLAATAKLAGTLAAPEGTIDVQGRGLRLLGVPAGIAPGRAGLHAAIHGNAATLDAEIDVGTALRATLKGDAPLGMGRPFDLAAEGSVDLAMLNPVLSAEGRSVRGRATFDASIGGTYAAPRLAGTARVTGGEVQDSLRGVRIAGIALSAEASGATVRIVEFTGRAGPGTISGSGTIDLDAPGTPIDLAIEARNARPIASDRLTATVNADLRLRGALADALSLSGTVEVVRAEIALPDSLPPDVVVLNVLRSGESAPQRAAAPRATRANFDVTVTSPGQFFVRGRGLNAEVEGRIHAGGTDTAPAIEGGFTLRRGTLNLAGQTLDFTRGSVTFDGAGLRNGLDPTLDFLAQSVSAGVTARVAVTGYASLPRVQLSSLPPLPQDEILARLIFRQSASQLSPFQLAEIAQAAAALGGVGTGFNPVASVRESLGLDRLAVGSAANPAGGANQTTLEAGKYVTRNVYVGTKQGLSGGTQAEVQIDLTKNLKVQGTVNTGANATVTQGAAHDEIGTSVGLSYQFEY